MIRCSTQRALLLMALVVVVGGSMVGCNAHGGDSDERQDPEWSARREQMVRNQIEARGVKDASVL